ncbi:MAG: TonB family protein [Crocinitomicaceae bacterium]|nr:TonB family protein [Crocinitomicaceae bacterium]MCF8433517.1 TonB family protein [Crocinitomicaceae bacterium]
MIGQIISNYEVKSLLGAGGMGTVYLAEHVKLGRQVAIKSLHAQFVNSEEIRARFIHEAKVMGQLQHPNIVTLYDYVETETGLFLIIELVDGKPIDDYIEQVSGPIEEGKAIEMMNEILEGFQYAHEKGLVHRDIKPSNLVIAAKNKVKILDFGIAKLVGDTSSKMTKTGTQIGTVYYMSPEQVKGDELDQRSDIYALGVTFFQMLTGNSPYKGMTKEFEVFMKIVNEELPDPRTIYPGVSEHMCAVIQKATAKDANDRFQSCDEFAAALKDKSITLSTTIENSDSNLENAVHETKVNKDVNAVIDQPDSEVKPQIISAKAVQQDVKESPTSTDDVKSSPTEKNKRFKLYGLIGAAVVLIGIVIYFLIPSEKENITIENDNSIASIETILENGKPEVGIPSTSANEKELKKIKAIENGKPEEVIPSTSVQEKELKKIKALEIDEVNKGNEVKKDIITTPNKTNKVVSYDDEVIEFPDVEAGFPGGTAGLQRWIVQNIQYPQAAIEKYEQGRVYLSFVVEKDGSISNIVIERGVSPDLDREAKRVVRTMPNWIPGEEKGKRARVRCRLPINFTLD